VHRSFQVARVAPIRNNKIKGIAKPVPNGIAKPVPNGIAIFSTLKSFKIFTNPCRGLSCGCNLTNQPSSYMFIPTGQAS
jgi:hypothetical protein